MEFKNPQTEITKNVYVSNHDSGHIFLGVKDSDEIISVGDDKVDKVKTKFETAISNKNKMYPLPFYLTPV